MTLATGQVTTVERVGGVTMPEESSTWAAMHRGRAGGGGRGGRGAFGGRGGRGGAEPPAAAPAQAPAAAPGAPSEARRRREPRQAQGQRQRSHRPQSRHRSGHHHSARHRFRVVEGWLVARVCRLVGEGRRRRRVRPQDERWHDRPAPQGQGQLQEPRLRRGGRAARVPERPGRVRQGRLAVSPLLLEGRRCGSRRARVGDDAGHAGRDGRERSGRAAVFSGRPPAVSGHGASSCTASGRRGAGAARRRSLALAGSAPAADAARARAAGAQSHVSRRRAPLRQAVRPARHAGFSERGSGRRSGARHRHVRAPVSPRDVLGYDLQRRGARRPEDWSAPAGSAALARHADDVARRPLPALFR